MRDYTAEEYRELARRCRAQATASMSGPAGAFRAIAAKYEAKAKELEDKGSG